MMLGNYWKQAIEYPADPPSFYTKNRNCKTECTYDYAKKTWPSVCDDNDCETSEYSGLNATRNLEMNSHYSGLNASRNVLGALHHPDIVIKTVPYSTTNYPGNCPTTTYFEKMTKQMNKENGTKESQLVLDMMKNLKSDAAQYAYGGFLTGGYWCAHAS